MLLELTRCSLSYIYFVLGTRYAYSLDSINLFLHVNQKYYAIRTDGDTAIISMKAPVTESCWYHYFLHLLFITQYCLCAADIECATTKF